MIQADIYAFKKYLNHFLSIPTFEWIHLVKNLRIKKILKDEFYFRQGEKFDEIGFVCAGLAYSFYTTESGKVHVKKFNFSGEPVSCYSNLIQDEPAHFSCKAIEDLTLVVLKYEDLKLLYKRHICWERMGRISAERLFIEKEIRQLTFLSMNARERYEDFIQRYPESDERIQQYLIASYLGISPVSLSRLRNS